MPPSPLSPPRAARRLTGGNLYFLGWVVTGSHPRFSSGTFGSCYIWTAKPTLATVHEVTSRGIRRDMGAVLYFPHPLSLVRYNHCQCLLHCVKDTRREGGMQTSFTFKELIFKNNLSLDFLSGKTPFSVIISSIVLLVGTSENEGVVLAATAPPSCPLPCEASSKGCVLRGLPDVPTSTGALAPENICGHF